MTTKPTKYDLLEIMTKSHMLRKDYGLNKSAALRQAWKLAKEYALKAERGITYGLTTKADIYEAFYKKNPNGHISGIFGAYQVQFTHNGKTYNYSLEGLKRMLGFAV